MGPHKSSMRIEIRHVPGCENLETVRALVHDCLRELRLSEPVIETEGDYPSPSLLVDGVDVMGEPAFTGAGCRLDLPTRQRMLVALRRA